MDPIGGHGSRPGDHFVLQDVGYRNQHGHITVTLSASHDGFATMNRTMKIRDIQESDEMLTING